MMSNLMLHGLVNHMYLSLLQTMWIKIIRIFEILDSSPSYELSKKKKRPISYSFRGLKVEGIRTDLRLIWASAVT